jgi:asparagine synthase (glutamine-hydrolysing)
MAAISGMFSRSELAPFADKRDAVAASIFAASNKIPTVNLLPTASESSSTYQDKAVVLHGPGARAASDQAHKTSDPVALSFILIATGTIFNRAELAAEIGLGPSTALSDLFLLRAAYDRWGTACPSHVLGEWSFVAWHPRERKLFLARDHTGNTSLYYYVDTDIFAFSTSRRTLLDLRLSAVQINELYLAQILVSWFVHPGERTIHSTIRRLPPAHWLTVTPSCVEVRQYWSLDTSDDQHLSCREDYALAFRQVFDRAVRDRLPGDNTIAATLSGGLDSGSVTATAADLLRPFGRRLTAYTSVPLSDPSPYVGGRFGDEFPLAQCAADAAGNVDLHRIDARGLSPIRAIRTVLDICLEPLHAAANLYWLLDLYGTAGREGYSRLLIGQSGNAGISWTGDLSSQSALVQLRLGGIRRGVRRTIGRLIPIAVANFIRRRRRMPDWTMTAIAPEFADELQLFERQLEDSAGTPGLAPPRLQRLRLLGIGSSIQGFLNAELGTACGLRVTDPTADPRVLSFCMSVPDKIFIDPQSGQDRWLIREAMKGRLPNQVRLNGRRGRQAGDLIPRLRACNDEVEAALDEIAAGPASAYLDLARMRQAWNRIQVEDNSEVFRLAVSMLMRGIMAGLFVNGFGKTS